MKYDVSERLIWFKGEILHVNDAKINILAPTSQFGLNVFEGIPCYWNDEEKQLYAFRLDAHYDRLLRSARLIQIDCPYSKEELKKAFVDVVKANEYDENLSVRQTLFVDGFGSWGSDGPTDMFVAPIPKGRMSKEYNKKGLNACITSWRRISDNNLSPRIKCGANYINSRVGQREALRNGYDTCIFLNEFGKVSEGPGSCFFMVKNGKLVTPQLTDAVLESITRDTVIELAKYLGIDVVERTIDRTELYTCDEAFLCGSAMEVTPVVSIDKYEIGYGIIAERIHKAYLDAATGTQMVFCDLSTPHNDGTFNVYDDLRKKLMEKGIPEEEIAFIHSADTEAKKKELFGKVRSGQVRVLIGSTQKMGAGTNVQRKLVALSHLDCPWRPSDLQQREGRIIRQGNENPEVEIYTYVTKNTFDSYLYQLVESKQKFISQIMTSKSPVRSAEDVDEQALSYAEIKALCTGNPYIKEKMDLDIEVARLKLLKANFLSEKYATEDAILKTFPKHISNFEQRIAGYESDIETVKVNTLTGEDAFSPMTVMGVTYSEKKEAGQALIDVCKRLINRDPVKIGSYRGFDMELFYDSMDQSFHLTMCGKHRHTVALGTDVYGNIQRIDNMLESFDGKLQNCKDQLETEKQQLAEAKAQVDKPFVHEKELKEKTERLAALNALLNMDKNENEIVDDERDESEDTEIEPEREADKEAR